MTLPERPALDTAWDVVRQLQTTLHTPDCAVHQMGTTDFPHCSCGRDTRIKAAGGKAKR